MEEQLFRKESMERISSPEQLQDYMRVTSPGIWMILAAVICLLGGLLICASVGRLETTVPVSAQVSGGTVTIVSEALAGQTADTSGEGTAAGTAGDGMVLRISGQEVAVDHVFRDGEGRMTATASADLPDGEYDAVLVTESVSPISFLLN